jgi:hypothetical protein
LQQNFSPAYIRAMSPRGVLPVLVLTAAQILVLAPASHAQLPERVERCLPYPTYAQEVDAMFSKPELNNAAAKKVVVIDSVDFDGPITLPEPARLKLVDDLKRHEFDADSKWLDEVAEVSLRGAWQDQGYFKVIAKATARDIGGDALHEHVALTAHVEEGLQYFQGRLNIQSVDRDAPLVFTQEVLRNVYPLREGDLFDADKIRNSLDAYRQLYAAHGYIDFSAVPDFDVDDADRRISLSLELDQNKQFRIDQVEVDGLDPKTESTLRSMIKPGDVFNYELVKAFFEENKSLLPPDASLDDVKINKNVKEGIASLRFDFFTCPRSANSSGGVRQDLMNAPTGKADPPTQVTSNPINTSQEARTLQTDQPTALEYGKCCDVRRDAGMHRWTDPDSGKLDLPGQDLFPEPLRQHQWM